MNRDISTITYGIDGDYDICARGVSVIPMGVYQTLEWINSYQFTAFRKI